MSEMSYAALVFMEELGRKLEPTLAPSAVFAWLTERVPVAMPYPDDCVVSLEYHGELYGPVEASSLSWRLSEAIRGENRPAGVLHVAYVRPHEFGDEERRLLSAIAHRIGAYVEVRGLIREARARATESDVLYQLGRSLSTRLRMDQVLEEIHLGVSKLIDASNFYIGFYDEERNEVTFPLNVTESAVDRHITIISADEGLTGYVLRSGQSLLIERDVAGWLDTHGIEPIGDPAACWLGVPLVVGDQVQGLLVVQDYQTSQAFNEADREMLTAIAGQASIAIQNARLFEELETRARHEQVLRQITARVRSSTDPETIVRTAVRELGKALGRRTFARLHAVGDLVASGAKIRRESEA